MTVTYRDATAADGPALKELFAESFIETFGHLYRQSDLDQFLDTNSTQTWDSIFADPDIAIHLAEEEGELRGFVELAPRKLPYESCNRALELRRLYLRSDAKGRGTADELMKWALREASRRGAQELILSVYVDNHRARRFYQRYGFEMVGKYDFKVGSHVDEDLILRHVIMQANA